MINKCQKDPTCGISLKRGMFMDNSESRMVVQGLVFLFFLQQRLSFLAKHRNLVTNLNQGPVINLCVPS